MKTGFYFGLETGVWNISKKVKQRLFMSRFAPVAAAANPDQAASPHLAPGPAPLGHSGTQPFSPYRQHETPRAILIADRNEGTFITLVIRTLFNANL